MYETLFVALLTGAFTLLGVWLAQNYATREAAASRLDLRRREARALLAEFVHSGVSWAEGQELLVPVLYKAINNPSFLAEFADTESGISMRGHSQTVHRSGGELRLIVKDTELLKLVSEALEAMKDTDAMGELIDEATRNNGVGSGGAAMAGAFRHYRQVAHAFRSVEARAAELLRGDL